MRGSRSLLVAKGVRLPVLTAAVASAAPRLCCCSCFEQDRRAADALALPMPLQQDVVDGSIAVCIDVLRCCYVACRLR